MGRRLARSLGVLFLVLSALCASANAQTITGQISGTVRDASGAVVVGATVTVINLDTKQTVRTLKTGKSGEYVASLLQVGNYEVLVAAGGFQQSEIADISLNVGDSLSKDISLVAGSSEVVTVTTSQNTPNVETNEQSSIIDNAELTELALNTRNFEQTLLLQPGVSYGGPDETNTGQIDPSGSRNSTQLSVNGLQPTQVQFLLDGADMLNHTTNGQVSIFPTIDSIQQIQTVRNNYGSQYGGGGSAQTIIVTKAGGSSYHGGAYLFVRNTELNANAYFNKLLAKPRPDQSTYDFGGQFGGPVFIPKLYPRSRSKTFFFASIEFKRLDQSVQNTNTTFPNEANVNGYFATPVCLGIATAAACPTGRAPMVANSPYPGYNFQIPNIDPVALAYLKDVFRPAVANVGPAPNPTTAPNTVLFTQSSKTSETQELLRIDHQFSERVSAFARVINDPITQEIPNAIYRGGGFPTVSNTTVATYGRDFLGNLKWTARANTVLEFGFSFLPYETKATPTGSATQANSPDVAASGLNLPFANTTGRNPIITIVAAYWSSVGNFTDHSNTYQAFENTTTTIGRHTLYYGVNAEHFTDSGNPGTNNSGNYVFSGVQNFIDTSTGKTCALNSTPTCYRNTQFDQSFAQFEVGAASTFSQASIDAHSEPHENLYEAYLQDNWRALSRLSLNMGVRYSIFQAPGDFSPDLSGTNAFPQGKLGGFQPEGYNPQLAPAIGLNGDICTGTTTASCATASVNPSFNRLNGIVGGGGSASPYGAAISRTPLMDFAPRVGFAWNVYGDGKTSLRGGFGMFYNSQPLITFQNAITGNPAYVQNPVYSNPASFANPAVISAGTAAVGAISGINRHWKQPYVEAWNLSLQQQITKNDLFDIAYVGNNTQHLQGEEDINQIPAGQYLTTGVLQSSVPPSAAGTIPGTAATEQVLNRLRPYQGYGPISYIDTRYFADYNGLQVSLLHREGKKGILGLSYTWSKALANSTGPPNGQSGAQQFDPQNRFDLKPEWGPTLLDRRNIFVAHFAYKLPSHNGYHGLKAYALNGYEVSGIYQAVAGIWWTAFQGTIDVGGQGGAAAGSSAQLRPDQLGDPNHYSHSQAAWFNPVVFRNSIPAAAAGFNAATYTPGQAGGSEHIGVILGPGYQAFNLSMFKNFELPENMRVQLRVEAQNLPNHTSFKNLQTQTSNAGFGQVTSAYANRQIQVGAKINF